MPEPDLFLVFVEPLNRAGIAYMILAALALPGEDALA
jgi:hypothetical protein